MNRLFLMLAVLCLALGGCASHPTGVSKVDAFENTRVMEMSGNDISWNVFQRTIVCLNARCETRRFTATTNTVVTTVTNRVLNSVTNLSVTTTTNTLTTLATNQLPPPPPAPLLANTNTDTVLASAAPPERLVNTALSRTGDSSISEASGNNQNVKSLSSQSSLTLNQQVSLNLSNAAISALTNTVVRSESLQTITTVTNWVVSSVTNTVVTGTNGIVHDHYLVLEWTPPADFTLATNESLVVLADGVRFGCTPAPSMAEPRTRKGYTVVQYRTTSEALVAIANANEVRVRLRGTTGNIERKMHKSARANFKKFLAKYYTPEAMAAEPALRPANPPNSNSQPQANDRPGDAEKTVTRL